MVKPIFNSLGSNYSGQIVSLALKGFWRPFADKDKSVEKLERFFNEKFRGKTLVVYKGRDAIEIAVRATIQRSEKKKAKQTFGILTQGFACHAIEEGILRGGATPVYVDLEANTLSPSIKSLEAGMRWAKVHDVQVVAVFLQHTLGYLNPTAEIRRWCKRYNLLLIEDLAQSYGATDEKGIEAGTTADAVICSFGRDKILDGVSGGAVIFPDHSWSKKHFSEIIEKEQSIDFPPVPQIRKEMLYPLLTSLVRNTHQFAVGKIIFQLCKKFGLFTSPISSPTISPTKLPAAYARIVLSQLNNLQTQLAHRRKIAAAYSEELKKIEDIFVLVRKSEMNADVHLRVPILMEGAAAVTALIENCQKKQIFLSDRWYRSVVDSGSLGYKSIYHTGLSPVAENSTSRIMNLPTHQGISINDVQRIVKVIKETATTKGIE
jgi:dTDP-4-amino-4,6-dideoxygalactose transaminase